MAQVGVDILMQVVNIALPIAVAFEVGNLIIGTVLRVGFGGKLWFGK